MRKAFAIIDLDGKRWGVPDWIVERRLLDDQHARGVLSQGFEAEVRHQTEKAVLVAFVSDDELGTVKMWCPKSVLISEEELLAAAKATIEHYEKNERYYQYLRKTAKDNGVKLGSVRKWAKIQAKLDEAGVEWVKYADFAA